MVEAVLWLPIFLVIFGLMVDSALVFHGQSKVLRVVQDADHNLHPARGSGRTAEEITGEAIGAVTRFILQVTGTPH